jgi:hypothetical protein
MAISINFNAAVIYKPGAYSKSVIDLGGNFPLGATGIVGVIGEASAGPSGLFGPFSADQLQDLQNTYVSGSVVDAARFLFAPSTDAAIPSGANFVYVYKTNASSIATLLLASNYGTVYSVNTGTYGNGITFKNDSTAETPASVSSALGTTVDLTAGDLDDKEFYISVNGGKANRFTCPAVASKVALSAALADVASWSLGSVPSGISFTVGGVDAAATLTIAMSASATANRNGFGRNFVLYEGAGADDALVLLGIDPGIVVASVEPKMKPELKDTTAALTYPSGGAVEAGGEVVMELGYYDSDAAVTAATVTINATQMVLTVTGGANAATASKTITLSAYSTLTQLVDYINSLVSAGVYKWKAKVSSSTFNATSPQSLDRVSLLGCLKQEDDDLLFPARIKKDNKVFRDFMALCSFAQLTEGSASRVGFPDAVATASYLAGGALGGTLATEIATAYEKMSKVRLNSIVPLFSRDATEDMADGLTDTSSTYTIDAIHALMKSHLSFTAATKKRSERQGYLSFKGSYEDSKAKAATMGDGRIQMVIQDCKQASSLGVIQWFQPWATACFLAGGRAGSIVGTPMTYKYLGMTGIRHSSDPMTTAEGLVQTDFDPDIQYDDAIASGITFLEAPQTGGFRVVVDNTTYGKDGNWVFNRANVLYAADVVAYDFRNQMESIYVGRKNTVTSSEVSSVASSILTGYMAQGLLVSPGFKNLTVKIVGNEIRISVTIVLVEGIDFVLTDFIVTRSGAGGAA